MFEPGGSNGVSGAVRTAPELTAALTETQRAVNRLDARRVHDAYDLLDVRLCAEFDRQERSGDGDAVRASKAAANDVSVALNVSFTAAATMLDAGEQLWHRLPLIDTEFTAGALDYARIKVITGVLAQASDATVAVLEPDVLAAAHLYNTKALRDTIWELWTDHNPDEAAEVRKRNLRSNIGVRRSKRHDGGTDVTITTSDHSADDFLARIAELVDTVCENDTRSKGELQAAAVTAMAHGSTAIECTCTRADCPVRGAEIVPAPKKRIAAYMDIELLLGLTSNPPTLADGTPLPADVARLIATDAQWQIILTDMLDLAAPEIARRAKQAAAEKKPEPNHDPEPEDRKGPTSNRGSEADDPADDADSVDAPESSGPKESETDPTTPRKSAPPPPTVAPACRQRTRVMRRRSRIYTAAPLPEPDADHVHRPRLRGWHTALLAHIADLLAAIDRDPALARGVHPDGHGGHSTPPRGALTYAPTAEVKALVLARYRTCTAPGCHRPSADCQLDHVVEFDHDNPLAGGWTVVENLQPLCLVHHHAKTEKRWRAAILAGGFVCWRLDTGTVRITAPAPGVVALANMAFDDPATGEPDPDPNGPWRRKLSTPLPEDIDAPTWWEKHHMHHEAWEHITLSAIARLKTSEHRDTARRLRNKYLEHKAVLRARYLAQPPPY